MDAKGFGKISIEKRQEIIEAFKKRYASFLTWEEITDSVDEFLKLAGVEVEEPPEPPVMPEGLSGGTWLPCCGHDADKGKYYIFAEGNRIAEVYTAENRIFMTGSKEVTKKMIKYLEGITSRHWPDSLWNVVIAIEKQGVNMDKFRG